uniref:Retrotransposon gag domain-containing protein n=1 Tax=Trichuris muris TaxID=70415 RepID=A0A5S6R4P7_TRIMR
MEWLLRKKKLWKYVDGSVKRPVLTQTNVADVEKFDEQSEIAQATIILAIEPSQQQHIRDCGTAQDVWEKLKAAFEPKSRPRMMQLTRALIDNKCSETEPMEDYVTRTKRLAAQLKEAGLEFNDDQLTTILIANLPSSYDSVASAIMCWDESSNSLSEQEKHRKR